MRTLACFFLLTQIVTMAAFAANYSCRDSQGRLYLTDNLQALPDECRAAVEKMKPEDPDNLNFVPQKKIPKSTSREFQQQINEVDEKRNQKELVAKDYLRRAERSAVQYQQAVVEKRQALRRWNYKSRDTIRSADKKIEEARAVKNQLLEEMRDQRLKKDQERLIRAELNKILDQ
jgi:hypothetical protein